MSLKHKNKVRFLAFPPYCEIFSIAVKHAERSGVSVLRRKGVQRACPMAYFFGTFFRTSEKSAAMCRFNFRGQASEITNLIFRENTPVFVP